MGYLDNAGLAYFWGKVKAILPGGSSGGVPVGTIVIWSGTAEDIPDGWALCDGQDGRPDLRDKFVLGAGTAHAVGATGGEETHTLTVKEMPEHNHETFLYSAGSGSNKLIQYSVGLSMISSVVTTNKGGSQPHNNMPPYYALCYIIKTAEDSGGGGTSGESNPIGTVISFMGTSAPEGYLVCDGAEYGISQYPALASFFQAQFGTKNHFGGDGTATFAVPDMRNLFLRGYHGEAEEQLSGEIGAKQEATIYPMVGHSGTGEVQGRVYWVTNIKGTAINVGPKNVDSKKTNEPTYYGFSRGAEELTTSYVHDDNKDAYAYTSRPVNMAVLYCIKAVESSGGGGGGSAGEAYSTEEQVIGTWTDGKPLYRRVLEGITPATTNLNHLILDGLHIDRIVNFSGFVYTESAYTEPIVYSTTNSRANIYCVSGTSLFMFMASAANTNRPYNVIIEYTKTTD